MSKVIITAGIPASGKTSWARQYVKENPNTVISCRDDIRAAHGFTEYGKPEIEQRITNIQRGQIEAAFLENMDVIVADTNINKKFRNQLVKFAHQHGADVEIKVFPISLDEAILRDSNRERRVGPSVIMKMHQQFESQNLQDESLPVRSFEPYKHAADDRRAAIVVDIDGTVARHVGRSPYDYSRVLQDEYIDDVCDIVNDLSYRYKVIFVSGRDDSCEADTRKWLDRRFFGYTLFMRKTGDPRPDWVIKNEIYDTVVIPNYNVHIVFDDRDQVVTHLRRRGITVAQVAPGRF